LTKGITLQVKSTARVESDLKKSAFSPVCMVTKARCHPGEKAKSFVVVAEQYNKEQGVIHQTEVCWHAQKVVKSSLRHELPYRLGMVV